MIAEREQDPPRMDAPRAGVGRRLLRTLSSVMIVSGLLLLLDAGLTVLYQEPLSAVYNRFQQDKLGGQLATLWDEPTPLESKALSSLPDDDARMAFQSRALNRKAKKGQPVGRIKIKKIGLSIYMVEGTDTASLRKGPGHYPDSPLPGAPGTVAVAGHRTTYGAPFRKVDKLRRGDTIEVDMPYGKFTYRVERTRIVAPTAVEVTKRVAYDRLVLTACHPLYSAAQRIVVFARLVGEKPSTSLI
jgi:sortase A